MWKQHSVLVIIWLLIISNVLFLLPFDELSPIGHVCATAPPAIEDATTYWNDDWTVDSNAIYRNQTIIVNGNLTVTNGYTLTIINTTIMMNCTQFNGQYHIDVLSGGTFRVLDYDQDDSTTEDASLITDSPYDIDNASTLDYAYNFSVNWGGLLEIRNSSVRECGWASSYDWEQGISVYGDYCIFDHVNINNRFKGIVINSAFGVSISNCTIQINATEIDAYGIHGMDCTSLIAKNNTINMGGSGADQLGLLANDCNYSYLFGNIITMSSSVGWGDGLAIAGGLGNRAFDNTIYQYIDGSGIILWYTDSATVAFNKVRSNSGWCQSIYSQDSPNSIIYENDVIVNTNGVGISLQGDCQNIVVYNNSILGNTDYVDGIDVFWAYNRFTIINSTITLTGANSFGLHCHFSSHFDVYGLKVTISDQYSVGLEFWFCDNITVMGANITTSPAATFSDGVWIEDASDIFIVDLKVNLQNDWGAGIELLDRANKTIIILADVQSTGANSPALEGDNCHNIILINSTLNAPFTDDIIMYQNASVSLLNTTFSDENIVDSLTQLIVGWYLHVQVQDASGNPFPGINVQVEHPNTMIAATGTTDFNGWIKWIPVLGYIQTPLFLDNSSNPHVINASNTTCWDIVTSDLTNSGQTVIMKLVNDDPIITNPMLNVQVHEDTVDSWDFNAIDKEYNQLVWSIDTSEDWVSLDPSTGEFTANPNETHVGNHLFNVRVTDINSGYDQFNIAVKVINRAPVIQTTHILTVTEDSTYNVDYDSDDDPATTWTLYNGPNWLSLDTYTGVLSGTPDNGDVGVWDINLSVEDSHGGISWNNFTLTVNNDPPIIITNDYGIATEDQQYYRDYDSSDDASGITTWSLITGPSWLSINPNNGVLSGKPTNAHIGQKTVIIEVNDGNGGTDRNTFTLIVNNIPPKILTNDVLLIDEDSKYNVDYESSDDGQGTIVWSLITNAGDWLDIDPTTGILSGTPLNEHVGSYWVNVTVHDDHDGFSWHNFTLTVNNTNDVPVIITQDVLEATEDQLYSVEYKAVDDDGDTLIWSLTTKADWLSLSSFTGELSGTPSNLDIGIWEVTIRCNDRNNGIARHTFNLTVINVNDPPIITYYLPPDTYPEVEEGLSLDFNITYIDEDSVKFTVFWTLDGLKVRSDVPFWTYHPTFGDAGDHEVIINVTDNGGASVSQRWIVIVTTANRAPIIDEYTPMNLKPILNEDDSKISFNIIASDPDNDQLRYEWYVNGEDTGERTSSFTFDRSSYDPGTYNLSVRITDSEGKTTEQTWTIDVKPTKSDDSTLMVALIILFIIIIVIIILAFIFLKKKKIAQIEDIFVVSNSGILLAHRSKEIRPDIDDQILGGMLTAIQDFIRDAFKDKTEFGLRRLDFGDSEIHLKRGNNYYIAVVLSGTGQEPADLEDKLEKTIERIEENFGEVLENWKGDLSQVRGIKDQLDDLLT